MSKLGELKKLIATIDDRIGEICDAQCREVGLDADKVLSSISKSQENGGEDVEDGNVSDVGFEDGGIEESEKESKVTSVKGADSGVRQDADAEDGGDEDEDDEDRIDAQALLKEEKKLNAAIERMRSDVKRFSPVSDKVSDKSPDSGEDSYSDYLARNDAIQERLHRGLTNSDLSPSEELPVTINAPEGSGKGWGSAIGSAMLKRIGKSAAKLLGKSGAKTVAKRAAAKAGMKVAAKAGGKALAKGVTKGATKGAVKGIAKRLPFGLGIAPAAAFAAGRLSKGDTVGAAGEIASGVAGAIPFVGTPASLGIDVLLAKRDIDRDGGEGAKNESACRGILLYDRAKRVFESESGVNESTDGYVFDDYVAESLISNGILGKGGPVDESAVFYGFSSIVESFGSDVAELDRLFKLISPDGKVSISDLSIGPSDSPDMVSVKEKIKKLLEKKRNGQSNAPFTPSRQSLAPSSGSSDFHTAVKGIGDKVTDTLSFYGIPKGITKSLGIPSKLGKLAGAGIGGLMFGPVGAAAGYGLADLAAKAHDRYVSGDRSRGAGEWVKDRASDAASGVGGLVGMGVGSLLGGPVGGVVGAGLGTLGQKALEKAVKGSKGKLV